MKMNFIELKNFIEDMTAEVRNLPAAIEYTERFLMDESPLVPQHIAEMKADRGAGGRNRVRRAAGRLLSPT